MDPLPNGRRTSLRIIVAAFAVLVLAILISSLPSVVEYRREMTGAAVIGVIAAVTNWIFERLKEKEAIRKWLVLIVLILGLAGGYLASKWLEPARKKLLYISPVPQFSRQPFYREFLDELVHQAGQTGFDVIPWLPDKDFDSQSQKRLLLAAAEQKREYAAVIFTPFLINQREDEDYIFNFLAKMRNSNLVLFDTDLSDSLQGQLSNSGLDIPACVKGDEREAARLATEVTFDYFSRRPKPNPTIAVFDKLQGSSLRSAEYQKRLKQGARGITPLVRIWLTTRYSREEATEIALRELSGVEKVDAIFTGNDVSALGVREAIMQLRKRKPALATNEIKIIGYDGITEVNRLLQSPDEEFLINSVDVRLPDQVATIIWTVNQLLSSREKIPHYRGRPCIEKEPRLLRSASLPTGK